MKATQLLGLIIRPLTSLQLHAYSVADWAGLPDDPKSFGGFAIYLGCTLISWAAKKQQTVSCSSIVSEYKVLADATAELIWLRSLLGKLRLPPSPAPLLWCDNLGASYLSANPIFHARTKHIEVDFHFVRVEIASKRLVVRFISSYDQFADVMTKPLTDLRFCSLCSKLCLFA